MKDLSFKDCEKLQSKLKRLQEQADKIKKFIESKTGAELQDICEYYNYDNELYDALSSIEGAINCALENIFNA